MQLGRHRRCVPSDAVRRQAPAAAARPRGGRRWPTLLAALAVTALACASARPPPPPPPPPPAAPQPAPEPPPVDAARELALGRAALADGRVAEAREHLEAAVGADPAAAEARLALAELLVSEGADLGEAQKLLDEAQVLHADPARVARLSGALAELRGDDAAAADAYGRALRAAPDVEVRLRRGLLLARIGRAEDARSELTRVVAEDPSTRAPRSVLAELYERSGQRDVAEHELTVLAALAPAEPVPLRALAAFYRRGGEPAKAAAVEERARALEGEGRKLRPLPQARR